MKILKIATLFIFLSTVGLTSVNAQCNFSPSANANGTNVNFLAGVTWNPSGTYFWDFGDGNTSTQQNPLHTYTASGTYYYCVTVDSCAPVCDSLVLNICSYDVHDTINAGNNCNTVDFWTTGGGNSYFWDFGDGNTSTQQNPQHVYSSSGAYYYCLTIDSCPPVCDSIVITCNTTTCNYTVWANDSVCNNVNFGTSAFPSSTPIHFWDFGDGFTATTTAGLTHVYANSGTYYYCVTIDSCAPICDSIVVTCNSVGISTNNSNLISDVNIYPNPFKDKLTIELNLINQTQVEIFVTDLLGNTVAQINNKELKVENNKLQWNAENLSNGIYLLNIKTNNSLQIKKLILNK